MITTALITLIISLLMGGTKSLFITPKLAERVKKNAKDGKKKKEVLDQLNKANKLQARFVDRVKSYKKMISDLASEKEIEAQEYKDLFEAFMTDRKQLQNKAIEARLSMLKNLTPKEFELCMDKDYTPNDKSFKKASKGLNTHLSKMKQAVKKGIKEESAQKNVLESIDAFNNSLSELINTKAHMYIEHKEVLVKYDASVDELKEVTESINEHRIKVYISFIVLHENIAKATTEKQWNAASKALKTLI